MENKVKTPFLDFYFSCMETGRMPVKAHAALFVALCGAGDELTIKMGKETIEFTPLRQTIVLLCSQIAGEKMRKR